MSDHLDPSTEARLQEAFAQHSAITARAVSRVAGFDYGRVLEDIKKGRLRGLTFGKRTAFTAGQVRLYLTRPPELEPATTANVSTRRRRAKSNVAQFGGWTERRAARHLQLASDRTKPSK